MRTEQSERLEVDVQLMADPCMWRWEIRDSERGEVVEDSWTAQWKAYNSPEEAYRAACERLDSLGTRS